MRIHRFFTEFNYHDNGVFIREPDLVHQIAKVFRMKKGDRVVLCDGNMHEVTVEILELDKDFFRAQVVERAENKNEPAIRVSLYAAILKRELFEIVVQKAVECGVFNIVPLVTQRTIKSCLNVARLRKIAKEAAEQSGRGIIPSICDVISFHDALRDAKKNDENILFDFSGEPFTHAANNIKKTIGIFIGPEGGFSREEVDVAATSGMHIKSLGLRTLRAETAAIVAAYLLTSDDIAR